MQVSQAEWSQQEQEIAHQALRLAYERETSTVVTLVREKAGELEALEDLWKLHDYLSARRHDIDGKYDDTYSMLVFVFARLVKEGWLKIEELEGLDRAKVSKVNIMSRM